MKKPTSNLVVMTFFCLVLIILLKLLGIELGL